MTETIPPETKLAAKRGFIRTTAQSYAATLSTGIPSAAVIVALIQDPTGWLLAGITVVLALATPPLAGLASYLSIISKGLPEEYTHAANVEGFEQGIEVGKAVAQNQAKHAYDPREDGLGGTAPLV